MRPGIYKVRGNAGHGEQTPRIDVEITADDPRRALFTFAGVECVYENKDRSPYPRRVSPRILDNAIAARSIAHAAFKAASSASNAPAEEAPPDNGGDDLDVDALTIGAMRSRNAGPDEGRFTSYGK